jgi:hypothetical protein
MRKRSGIFHKARLMGECADCIFGLLLSPGYSDQHAFIVDLGRTGMPKKKNRIHNHAPKTQ